MYSEAPFLQQEHEEVYEVTRYLLSSPRRLFNDFEQVESELDTGQGTAMSWAIEKLSLGFALRKYSRMLLKSACRILFSSIKYFDYYFDDKPQALDGASCTYLSSLMSNVCMPDTSMLARYVDVKDMRHP